MENAILSAFSFLVEAIILWQYASSLFDARHRQQVRIAVLSILYLFLFSVSLLESEWLNTVCYFFINLIFLITHYRLKWSMALFHSAILTAVMWMYELIAYSMISLFIPHFFVHMDNFHIHSLFAVLSKIMLITIICILIHILGERQNWSQIFDKSIFLLFLMPITTILMITTLLNISIAYNLSLTYQRMFSLSAVFLLVNNLFLFGINQSNQKKNLEFTEMQLLLQKKSNSTEYNKMLFLQNENKSILIHDIKKHLQTIDLLNDQGEHGKIKTYIQQLMISTDLKETSHLCENKMFNAILCRYQGKCNNQNIFFNADIRSGTTDFIAYNDLTSLFCNLLDNALEAANNIPASFIEINVRKREKTPFILITVVNSCLENPFSEQNGKLTTNKPEKDKHGFGIKSIQKVVKKYHGDMQMYYHEDTFTFHTIITLRQQG